MLGFDRNLQSYDSPPIDCQWRRVEAVSGRQVQDTVERYQPAVHESPPPSKESAAHYSLTARSTLTMASILSRYAREDSEAGLPSPCLPRTSSVLNAWNELA